MADTRKNNLLVVVVVILAYCSLPSYCFTQELQEYTQEIARRSYNVAEYFKEDSLLMRFGQPILTTLTFIAAFFSFESMVRSFFPGISEFFGFTFGLPVLSQMPTEMTTARDGQNREQRLIEDLDHKVQSSVLRGQAEYGNELKKKKK